MNKSYSIKDLEALSGIKAHTIRIWEQRYKLFNPTRTETNIRQYSSEDLKLLLNISVLNAEGYKISKIAKLDTEQVSKETYKLLYANKSLDTRVEGLKHAMLNLDEKLFIKILDDTTFQNGFEKTMEHLVYPFLRLIGSLWQTGAISPLHEHFASAIIRQKLMVAIDMLPIPTREKEQGFLLVCPDGEQHEIGLLYCNYIIRSRGYFTLFLGTSIPVEDVNKVLKESNIQNVLLSIIINSEKPIKFLEILNENLPNSVNVYVTGAQINNQSIQQQISRAKLLFSLKDLDNILKN